MKKTLSFNSICTISGVIFLVLGIYAILYPGIIMSFLSILSGTLLIIFAVFEISKGLSEREELVFPTFKIFLGIICAILGLILLFVPSIPYILFAVSFGIWALLSGSMKLSTALRLYKLSENTILLFVVSIIHLLFGIIMIFFPMFSSELFIRVLGAYFIYIAVCLLVTPFMSDDINII